MRKNSQKKTNTNVAAEGRLSEVLDKYPAKASGSGVSLNDNKSPSVNIDSPAGDSIIPAGSSVTISFTAKDNNAVSKSEVFVNGQKACSFSQDLTTYSCKWEVPKDANKDYTILVKATDASNNSAASAITVRAN